MTTSEINHFNITTIVGNDSKTYTGLEAYNAAMVRRYNLQNQSSQTSFFGIIDDGSALAIISIISLVGVSAIGGFFYFKRKDA